MGIGVRIGRLRQDRGVQGENQTAKPLFWGVCLHASKPGRWWQWAQRAGYEAEGTVDSRDNGTWSSSPISVE